MKARHTVPFGKYRINSTSVGSSNAAIIFIHGNSQTGESWDLQLSAPELNSKYKLISFDLPGHGQSDWFTDDPTLYDLKEITNVVKAIIDFYHPERYILAGLSYGTNLIAELTGSLPGCKGFVLAGAHILDKKIDPAIVLKTVDALPITLMPDVPDEELEKFCFYLTQSDLAPRRSYALSYRKTDPLFRAQVAKTLVGGEWSDEPLNITSHHVSTYVIYGRNDQVVQTDHIENYRSVWNPEISFIENSGHIVNQEKPEEFNRLLLNFADKAFK